MKHLLIGILTILALAGCDGCKKYGEPNQQLEDRLKNDFYMDLDKIGSNRVDLSGISFTFTDGLMPEKEKGICSMNMFEKNISLDTKRGYCELYFTFVHEVGHCTVYGPDHDPNPKSIMASGDNRDNDVSGSFCSGPNGNERKFKYLKDLFKF